MTLSRQPGVTGHDRVGAPVIAVVIPCHRVGRVVLDVIARIGPEVAHVLVVDDACPDGAGAMIAAACDDPRVTVLRHAVNQGVGSAVVTGYREALRRGADIAVKVDGDGQMPPELIPAFVAPIAAGQADYVKGNRFYSRWNVRAMPTGRLIGNGVLSFVTKLSSGYYTLFDPTNGYTAVHADALRRLDLAKLSPRYFFETDMLIHLGAIRAVARDLPMAAVYGDEVSGLRVARTAVPFLLGHLRAFVRRIVYDHFLRDFSLATLQLSFGLLLLLFGAVFGAASWWQSAASGAPATTGTVMIAVLPIILGFQLLLNFLAYDIANEPRHPLLGMPWLPPATLGDAAPGGAIERAARAETLAVDPAKADAGGPANPRAPAPDRDGS